MAGLVLPASRRRRSFAPVGPGVAPLPALPLTDGVAMAPLGEVLAPRTAALFAKTGSRHGTWAADSPDVA
jgi:hypothetical protein